MVEDAAGIDWDAAFQNAAFIPGGADYPARWQAEAAAFRAVRAPRTIAYGPAPRETLDLFLPAGAPRGLAVFVHGGYWLRFDKDVWSHLAAGPLTRGWAVALPSYPLAPAARIADIAPAVAAAVTVAAAAVPGPIRLAGHSAGGHLVARQLMGDAALAPAVVDRIAGAVAISGVFDLMPLRLTAMNAELRLTAGEAAAESPARGRPRPGAPLLTTWVGADERPEFLRQSALLATAWGAAARLVVDPGRHHFDVVAPLADPASPLVQAWLDSP